MANFHPISLYEFNRFPPWELFCSAYRAGKEAEAAKSSFEKLHHNRAVLLFSFSCIEAVVNYALLRTLPGVENGLPQSIERQSVRAKLDYLDKNIPDPIKRLEINQILDEYAFLRNELAHPKRVDQQAQFHTQHLQSRKIIELLQVFCVRIFLTLDGEFPYWITGWNYAGYNGSWRELYLHSNGNGFSHTLGRMDFAFRLGCGPGLVDFSRCHMSSLQHFDEISSFLDSYIADADPISPMFPTRPRLIRKWWEAGELKRIESEVINAAGWSRN
jgi:hypothetical protein